MRPGPAFPTSCYPCSLEPISITKARIVWADSKGKELGASPVTLTGTIQPESDRHFSASTHTLTSGTIEGAATKGRMEYVSVKIIEPLQ